VVAARDERGGIRGQERGEGRDLFRLTEAIHRVLALEELERVGVEAGCHQRRADEARPDRVHAHTLSGVLECRVLRRADDAVLGGDVRDRVREADRSEDRGDVHNRPAAVRDHRGNLCAHPVDHRRQVDVDHLLPAVDRIVGRCRRRPTDTSVVDGDLQRSEFLGRGDRRNSILRVGDIADVRDGRAARRLDLGDDRIRGLLLEIGDHDLRPVLSEKQRDRASDSRASTGDDR
jgi:hypothetical protein